MIRNCSFSWDTSQYFVNSEEQYSYCVITYANIVIIIRAKSSCCSSHRASWFGLNMYRPISVASDSFMYYGTVTRFLTCIAIFIISPHKAYTLNSCQDIKATVRICSSVVKQAESLLSVGGVLISMLWPSSPGRQCNTKPMVTFPATEHQSPLTNTIWWHKHIGMNNLSRVTWFGGSWESKLDLLITSPMP